MRVVIGMPLSQAGIVRELADLGYQGHHAPTDTDAALSALEDELGQIVLVDVADEAAADALVDDLGDAVWRPMPRAS